jgi:hypothetical protein
MMSRGNRIESKSAHAATATLPPGRLVLMGELTGPVSWRPLNQTAANHTLVPGGLLLGKFTRIFDRLLLHSNFQSPALVDGSLPRFSRTRRTAYTECLVVSPNRDRR